MSTDHGWRHHASEIYDAGLAVRRATPFDARARAHAVQLLIAAARRFSWWPFVICAVALALPNGWLWASGAFIWGVVGFVRAHARGAALGEALARETSILKGEAETEAIRIKSLVAGANGGYATAIRELLRRWLDLRPEIIASVTFELSEQREPGALPCWTLTGRALSRGEIADGVPRIGRGGRTVLDKRKATDVDEDLAQLNAAAALSVLLALFSGVRQQRVVIRLMLTPTELTTPILWVSLSGEVNDGERLLSTIRAQSSPVDAVRALGGDVGRCRAQRYTPAIEPPAPSRTPPMASSAPPVPPSPPTEREVRSLIAEALLKTPPLAPASPPAPPSTALSTTPPAAPSSPLPAEIPNDPYAARVAAVPFGEPAPRPVIGVTVPPPPAHFSASLESAELAPTPSSVRRASFTAVARRYAAYAGDPSARFVAFQHYWATYRDMAPGQLKFYFKWRNAVRSGEAPRTDLSYIFVHVYELLHVIGADGPADAARQLERLWTAYRPTYPQLDGYLVSWTADLLASEVGQAEAHAWIERAIAAGAAARGPEMMLVIDRYWQTGDYTAMPRAGIATLAGDPRLGDNKFYQQHNDGAAGGGWVDRAYRHALEVTDRFVTATHGHHPRDLAITREGLSPVSRLAFEGAVYEFKRQAVVLGKVPTLPEGSETITTYRNAVRYAENLLRREKSFSAKLRGIEVAPGLAQALDQHFAGYIRTTKPKPRVVIDLGRAKDLARESEDVRARLLAGLDDAEAPASNRQPVSTPPVPAPTHAPDNPAPANAPPPTGIPAGLLTDLEAVDAAIRGLSARARAVLDALVARGWEAPMSDPALGAAAGGALIGPLVDEINERSVDAVGDILIVTEGTLFVVQEDFRDEVYWVLHGTLDGFGRSVSPASANVTKPAPTSDRSVAELPDPPLTLPDTDGFSPVELRALAIVAGISRDEPSDAAVSADLDALSIGNATTPLLLLDRVNERALDSSYGDLLVDSGTVPPRLHEEAADYVNALLARAAPLVQRTPADATEEALLLGASLPTIERGVAARA